MPFAYKQVHLKGRLLPRAHRHMKDDNSSGVIVKLRIKWVRIKKRTPREAFTPEQLRGNCKVQAITEAGNGDSPSK